MCSSGTSSQHLYLEFSIHLLHIQHSQGFQSVPVDRSQGNLHFKVKETSASAWLLPLMHKSRDLLEFCSEWMDFMSPFNITLGCTVLNETSDFNYCTTENIFPHTLKTYFIQNICYSLSVCAKFKCYYYFA